jgi:hypothetical protein
MKKTYLLAVACYLAIPIVVMGGGFAAVIINPEWAIHTAHYTRNFHLLSAFKTLLMLGSFGLSAVLWLLMCYGLVRAKQRSRLWLACACLGPLGIAVLAALRDDDPAPGDAWQSFVSRLGRAARIAWETAFCLAAWTLSYQAMVLLRNVQILCQSLATGATVAQIVAQQNTMSGMYAFTEGNEVMYLVSLIYLFWPVAFNLFARLRHDLRPRSGRHPLADEAKP